MARPALSLRPLVLFATVLLAGCGDDEAGRLRDENDELRAQIANIREKASDVETASDELQTQIGRLDGEDWSVVVPDLKSAGETLESAENDLKEAVGN